MVSLSRADLERVAETQKQLLSPLTHATITAWRREAHRLLKELVQADAAVSILPAAGSGLTDGDGNDLPQSAVEQYPDRVEPRNARISVCQKAARLGAFNREIPWAQYLEEHDRSEYHDEYSLSVLGSCHVIGVATRVAATGDATGASQIILTRDRAQSPPFGERELALLRLVQPAYAAGVETCVRLIEHRAALARTLDTLSDGLLLCDGRGRVIHANAALESLMRSDPERGRLYREARGVAGALAEPTSPERLLAAPVRRTVRTTEASYQLEGNYLAEEGFQPGAHILVTVYPATPLMPTEEDIRNRFGLTRKEAAVTRLLADGKQNDAIAAALYISPHTARRHTESVMRKLGVASRAEIGPLLLRLDCDVPEQRRAAAHTLPRIEERSLSRAVAMRALTDR